MLPQSTRTKALAAIAIAVMSFVIGSASAQEQPPWLIVDRITQFNIYEGMKTNDCGKFILSCLNRGDYRSIPGELIPAATLRTTVDWTGKTLKCVTGPEITKASWTGFKGEVPYDDKISASWTKNGDRITWIDNRFSAVVVIECKSQVKLDDQNKTQEFVSKVLKSTFTFEEAFVLEHRFYFAQLTTTGNPVWRLRIASGYKFDEKGEGSRAGQSNWDSHIQVNTDGKFLIVDFELVDKRIEPDSPIPILRNDKSIKSRFDK